MTIQEILDAVNTMYVNTYEDSDKIKWISTLDKQINEELYSKYVNGNYVEDFNGYKSDESLETETLLPDTYASDIYRYYISAQIALANREMTDYTNFMTLFNNCLKSFKIAYNKSNEHIQPVCNWW